MIEWIVLGVIALVVVVLILWAVSIYNRFVSLKNSSEATLGQIRVAMKKRLDMIDELLGAVKSYAKFEKETLERVTAMRASVATASPGDLNKVDAESRSIFGRLLAVAEAYPDLKTSTTVTSLMDSVKTLEDEIARQRYTFNNISQEFNTMTDTIPSNFIANLMHLVKLEYLQFEDQDSTEDRVLTGNSCGRNTTTGTGGGGRPCHWAYRPRPYPGNCPSFCWKPHRKLLRGGTV
jgi:LemA protein